MTSVGNRLTAMAEQLRAMITTVAARFGDDGEITMDRQVDCDPGRPGRIVRWEYNIRVSARPGAAELLIGTAIPEMRASGWNVTNRDSPREFAVQFSHRGSYFGVHIARVGGRHVIVGGSTPCVAVR